MSYSPSSKLTSVGTTEAFLACIFHEARRDQPRILEYDVISKGLRPWSWPIHYNGQRVTPDELAGYERNHWLDRPRCLCSVLCHERNAENLVEMKAVFFVDVYQGNGRRQYMIGCARNLCGYLFPIEKVYSGASTPVFRYRRRDIMGDGRGAPQIQFDETKLDNKELYLTDGAAIKVTKPVNGKATLARMLMQLDEPSNPGISGACFVSLFAQCRRCKWVTTKRVFHHHRCSLTNLAQPGDVIDLTLEDTDDE